MYAPDEIRMLRRKVRENRIQFADRFFLTAETVKGWETGRRNVSGPALVILQMIEEEIAATDAENRAYAAKGRAILSAHHAGMEV